MCSTIKEDKVQPVSGLIEFYRQNQAKSTISEQNLFL